MTARWYIWAIATYIIVAIAFTNRIHSGFPEGMRLATLEIREDTVAFRPVPRQVLDSADSAWIMKARLEQFDRRRWWKK
jgi:hypothetical protein